MKLVLGFSGEGTTDQRFLPIIIGKVVGKYLMDNGLDAEIEWIPFPKRGSSHDNILAMCSDDKFSIAFFHRDSENVSWQQAYNNHFLTAQQTILNDQTGSYNKNLVPVIPVTEIEAWMLCNKELLKEKISTTLSNQVLNLTYRINHIQSIADPKSIIESAILIHNQTLTKKQRKYSVTLGELYDEIALDLTISDLDLLPAFIKLKTDIYSILPLFHK